MAPPFSTSAEAASAGFGGPAPLSALLGPTNTGKTHRAVERMLEHPTGMLGFPLRLLAREVYDKLTARLGERQVALVTGEEKRIPAAPRYWVCTVEAMPVDREVDFVAVDEIQLAAHPQRGHTFTARLLESRGRVETMFMGSHTMRPMIEQLLPTARIDSQPRLSRLRSKGSLQLSQLPPRTAVVAFGQNQVYEIAEKLRLKRGGAAVVLGALSPQTRNAQVAMYESGEVDYLVATDAIGMGLNLDVKLVVFAGLTKFDGKERRGLDVPELAQIAGRAGRYLNDGGFATLAPLHPLPEEITVALEHHQFEPLRMLVWRNTQLDFASVGALQESLRGRPARPMLRLVERADDADALAQLARDPEVMALVQSPEAVELLWEVCQVPDYGGVLVEHHARLLKELFLQLATGRGALDVDWVEGNVRRLDDTTGDLDQLMMRIELVRTWSYITQRDRWLIGRHGLDERTRALEDALSDALHAKLCERFVDGVSQKRGGAMNRPQPRVVREERSVDRRSEEPPHVDKAHPFAALLKLRDKLDPRPEPQRRAGAAADEWVKALVDAPHEALWLGDDGRITDGARALGRLVRGTDVTKPEVRLEELALGGGGELRVRRRLLAWARDLVDEAVGPLRRLTPSSASGRGLVYQLEQALGSLTQAPVRPLVDQLERTEREALVAAGVVFGRRHVYLTASLEPAAFRARRGLVSAYLGRKLPNTAAPPPSSTPLPGLDGAAHLLLGYAVIGSRVIRVDVLERSSNLLWSSGKTGPFQLPEALTEALECEVDTAAHVAEALGYRYDREAWHSPISRKKRGRR